MTSRGFEEKDFVEIVDWIDTIILDHENESKIKMIKEKVHSYVKDFPLY